MVVGDKKFGVVSYVIVGGLPQKKLYFPRLALHFVCFLK